MFIYCLLSSNYFLQLKDEATLTIIKIFRTLVFQLHKVDFIRKKESVYMQVQLIVEDKKKSIEEIKGFMASQKLLILPSKFRTFSCE